MTLSHVLTINVNYNYNQQMDYMERINDMIHTYKMLIFT